MSLRLCLAYLCALASPAVADPPALALPIDCVLGQSCYIEDYVDTDPGTAQSDYTCGIKSRDGHRGTDIVLLSFGAMHAGVNVLAAAPGTVAATRDGVADKAVTDANRDSIKGRECGNAVRIDHGDGWQTLYCHMKRGTISVRSNDKVVAGDVLGQVGLSGLTNIPHVHLSVLKDGRVIDPFNPDAARVCGGATPTGLWQNPPDYDRTGLFTAGFSTSVPSFDAVKSGAARVKTGATDLPIVLYAHAFYAEAGDTIHLSATGPDGDVFSKTVTIDDPKAQLFRAFGRRSPKGGWPKGTYRGYVKMDRNGKVLAVRHAEIAIGQ